ncbi:hypothetical protein ELG76_04110 [Rhizobium leguminosarum]|uniref:helix-turn-helix domain-containing protein n=1 Tax=Rhizobium leguminosarum TaxID=384 RepID=UPI00102FB36C|nr:helix-turn-helix domain-containing protein [Rhizobium leguminosarum]TBG78604.1 hypothetical protein ELG76_04110 [Rhizobium leguminosarum]
MQSVSGALKEQHTHYMAVREKLWFSKPKAVVEVVEPTPIVKIVYARRPAWKLQEVNFDLHVQQFRKRLFRIAASPTVVYIQDRCEALGVSYEEVVGAGRRREIVAVRHLLMHEIARQFGLSYPALGRLFGGRDHTSTLYAVRKIEALNRASNSDK